MLLRTMVSRPGSRPASPSGRAQGPRECSACVTKPWSNSKHKHEERVCVRRRESQFRNQGIRRKGPPVTYVVMESRTLKNMIRNERRVISSDELLDQDWRYENYPRMRTVDKHILRLL